MKLNRKGFTLIELLSTIVIISLVSGITITVALGVITNAKNKSKQLTIRNIETQAEKYIYEGFSNNTWYPSSDNTEYQCVTIKQLIEAGYFKAEILTENADILKENYTVKVTRNALNKAVVSRNLEDENITNDCTKITSNNSVITCKYDKEWLTEKKVTITYDNNKNTNVINGMYLNGIAFDASKIENGQQDPENVFHYTTNKSEMTVVVQSEGSIYANAMSSGTQIGSLVCIVNGIDNQGPTITVEDIGTGTYWINSKKEVKFIILVQDDHELNTSDTIEISHINILVNGSKDENVNKTIKLVNSSSSEATYELTVKNVSGNGKLSISFDADTFKDKAGNGNTKVTLPTNVIVDNIVPKLEEVKDCTGASCYNVNCEEDHTADEHYHPNKNGCWTCTSWHNDLNYTVTSKVKQDQGSPIQGGLMLPGFRNGIVSELSYLFQAFPITNGKSHSDIFDVADDAAWYMYISDEAGNYNVFGYGPYIINIDVKSPDVNITANGKNLTCTIGDSESKVAGYKICSTNCNSTNYTEVNPTEESKTVTRTGVANGTWYCYAIDAAGNEASASTVVNVNTEPTTISVTFNGYLGETSTQYNGQWTNQNVRLEGTVTTNSSKVQYKIDNNSTNPTSGWTDYTGKITQTISQTTNKTYYLHIKYKDDKNNQDQFTTQQLNVKIDKEKPTCSKTISSSSPSGVTFKINCSDNDSGCDGTYPKTYSNITKTGANTYTVYDKAGNTDQCTVNITSSKKRQYCKTFYSKCEINPSVVQPSTPTNPQTAIIYCKGSTIVGYPEQWKYTDAVPVNNYASVYKAYDAANGYCHRDKNYVSTRVVREFTCGSGTPTVSNQAGLFLKTSYSSRGCSAYSSSLSNDNCTSDDRPIYKCITTYNGA